VAYLAGGVHIDLEAGALEGLDRDLHGGAAVESSGEAERGRGRRETAAWWWGRNTKGGGDLRRYLSLPLSPFRLRPPGCWGISTKRPLKFSITKNPSREEGARDPLLCQIRGCPTRIWWPVEKEMAAREGQGGRCDRERRDTCYFYLILFIYKI
jgi:hypothetical protein